MRIIYRVTNDSILSSYRHNIKLGSIIKNTYKFISNGYLIHTENSANQSIKYYHNRRGWFDRVGGPAIIRDRRSGLLPQINSFYINGTQHTEDYYWKKIKAQEC